MKRDGIYGLTKGEATDAILAGADVVGAVLRMREAHSSAVRNVAIIPLSRAPPSEWTRTIIYSVIRYEK